MKLLLILLLASTPLAHAKDIDRKVGCFSAPASGAALKFVEFADGNTRLAYVKYRNSSTSIPLVFVQSSFKKVPNNRPVENHTIWAEFINGKYNGQYEVMTQGARYYKFSYKNKLGKTLSFLEDITLYDNSHTECKLKRSANKIYF